MIVVKIYNSMETELTNDEGPVSENLKIFRHFYYAKMCNLIGLNGVTKEYVDSLTAPDFECTYIDIRSGGFAELHFERIVPKTVSMGASLAVSPLHADVTHELRVSEEIVSATSEETEASTDKEALIESINKVIKETPDVPETTEVPETPVPVKRGRGRPKKNQ